VAAVDRIPSGKWRGTYRDGGGVRHSRTFVTKQAARVWAADREAEIRGGTWQDPKLGRVTVGEWHERWLSARVVEASTAAKNESHWRLYIQPRWGRVKLGTILRLDVQGWVVSMSAAGTGAETVAQAARLLSSMLNAAMDSNVIPSNPAAGVTLPRVPKQPDRVLTRSELDALLAVLDEPWRTLTLTAVFTGLRWAELAGLQVHRLDLLRRQLHVVEVLRRDGTLKAYPKSRASQRDIPLTPDVVAALAAHLARRPTDGFVFTGARGGPLNYTHVRSRMWVPALRRAGLPDPQPTFHDLRHTAISWLVAGGADLAVVQRVAGHESLVMTSRYAHARPDTAAAVVSALMWRQDAQ
jgi:integrase